MRTLLLSVVLSSSPALAVDVEAGIDADVAFAIGEHLSGPGGGGTARLGIGPNPIKLGPSGLSIMAEVAASYWRFPSATQGNSDMVRGLGGVRLVYTILWIRPPADDGGRGQGVRLDLPFAVRAGVGSIDGLSSFTPTADANIGLAFGFLPVQIGIHMGGGGLAASQQVEDLSGSGWLNAGIDLGVVF